MKKQRIIFVGVHNKPCKEPLDSSTISGKRIDQIIKYINHRVECIKSNLWEIDRFPLVDEQTELEILWHIKYDPAPNDIVVLLGGIVQRSFPKIYSKNILNFLHPSLQFSKIKPDDYVNNAVLQINNKLNKIKDISNNQPMNQSENNYKTIAKPLSIAAAKYSRESKMMDGNRCNIWEIDAFISGAEFATASLIQIIEDRIAELEEHGLTMLDTFDKIINDAIINDYKNTLKQLQG